MGFLENVKNLFESKISIENSNLKLANFRKAFLEKFAQLGIPTPKNEEWKYTNLSFLNDINFDVSFDFKDKGYYQNLHQKILSTALLLNGENFIFPIINGHPNFEYFKNTYSSEVSFENISHNENIIYYSLDKFKPFFDDSNSFLFLNIALFDGGVSLKIPPNTFIERPIVLFFNYFSDIDYFSNSLNYIEIGENSKVNFILLFSNQSSQKIIGNEIVNIFQKEGSEIELNVVQYDLKNLILINNINVIIERNSIFKSNTFSLSTKFVRNNLNVSFQGQFSSALLNGIYFSDTDNFVDDHTLIMHNVPNCQSDENFRGILDGKGRAVFNGKIFVARDSQKTTAYQSNKNLILSNEARINTKPQLEIYADDVKCTHGATVGFLDEEMLFYIISRGISKNNAKSMLLNSFISANLEKIEIPSLRDYLKELMAKKLHLEEIFFCGTLSNTSELVKSQE